MVNCINCAAPIDLNADKCPYCDTPYYDLTAIDFDSAKPCALRFKANGMVITQLAYPKLSWMQFNDDYTDAMDSNGVILQRIITNRSLESNVSFIAVPNKRGDLVEISIH